VVKTAGEVGADEEEAEGDDVDGDGMDLGLGVGVAEGFEDGGLEGDNGRGSIVGAEIGECSCLLLVIVL
jgi:hypothetical protein